MGSVVGTEDGKGGWGAIDEGLEYHVKKSGYHLGVLSRSGLKILLYLK